MIQYIQTVDLQLVQQYLVYVMQVNYQILLMGGSVSHESIRYNVPLQGTKEKGFSHIYRNPGTQKGLLSTPEPNLKSMKDVIYSAMITSKDKDFLGKISVKSVVRDGQTVEERELTKFTYGEVFDMATRTGSFLLKKKMEFNESILNMKLIGIFSKNRYQWLVADMACILYGMTVVPLYETLGFDNLTYCLEHSGITTLFVTAATIKTVLGLKGHSNLVNLICFDDLPPEVEKDLENHKFKVFHFNDVKKFDDVLDHKSVNVTGKNCMTFSYTSGTTGPPKGAMISHENMLAALAAIFSHQLRFLPDDSYVSFLPLPHIFERVVVAGMIYKGCFIAFYSGDILKFRDDVAFIKPTILVAVPRLYNRVVENVEKTFGEATGVKGCLINYGVSSKLEKLHNGGEYESGFYDPVVFSKVKQKFGGRIRMMITGSAPIKKETFEYMKILMSCPFIEGYGQTENTAAGCVTNSVDPLSGHCGGVVSSLEFKLNDIEEMHYTSDDKDEQGRPTPRGEVWFRGPSVFMGYYKDPEKTKESITPDGWLKTGDVAMLLPGSNAMKIIDRRKNIFKLQQGQYVAAEKVESIYSKSHLISESFLHGESHQNFAVAILVGNKDEIMKLAQKNNIKGTFEELCQDKNIRALVCKELDSLGKQGGLMSFEQAKNIYIDPQPFLTKGILSSTMKLQRFAAKKYYAKQIEDMYKEGALPLK